MTEYSLRPQAKRDLAAIADYGMTRWGEGAAEEYLRAIGKALDRYAASPGLGSDRSTYQAGLRKADVESHHAYYFTVEGGIDVIRILHPSMDAPGHVATGLAR